MKEKILKNTMILQIYITSIKIAVNSSLEILLHLCLHKIEKNYINEKVAEGQNQTVAFIRCKSNVFQLKHL